MDIATTTAPKSDQLNAEDLLAGPMTFTIKEVTEGTSEQPVNIHLAEMPGRPYRPSKSMRRVLLNAWGRETAPYAGRRITLYRDASVKFGPDAVGGIKISHLSHIDRPIGVALTVTRGKRATHTVDPLKEAPAQQPSPNAALLAQIKEAADAAKVDLATIAAEWAESHDGQPIKDATDLGGLELVRDDLRGRAS